MRLNPLLVAGVSILALSIGVTPAIAQETAPPAASDSPIEPTPTPTDETQEPSSTNLAAENPDTSQAIVVTGSRIRRAWTSI